jgi:hypothetical protein
MERMGVELSANISVSGAEQLNPVENSFQNIRDIQRDIQNDRDRQRNMPGYSGGGATGSQGVPGGSNLSTLTNYNSAHQLDARLQTITRVIESLTDQLKESTEKGQSRESFNISAALNNAEQERSRLEAEKARQENTTENKEKSIADVIKQYGLARMFTQGLGYFNQITGVGFNHRIAMANGDYLGADVSSVESYSNIAQGVGGSLMGAGMMMSGTPVGWALMGAGGVLELGGAIGKYWAGDRRADIAEGEAYRKTLAGTNGLNKLYTNGGSVADNAKAAAMTLRQGTDFAVDTGMSTDEFLQLTTRQARYGARSKTEALQQARDVALWAQSTGTDAGVISNFLGTARRYGDNSDVLGYASQARQAAGMTKAQNEEFLNALQGVIEDGIANGYVKSTEDVSKTFVMFARLSGNNPLWQGEQGAKRLQQMNSGISGATALQSVSDVLVMGAAHDVLQGKSIAERNKILGGRASGTYIDEMLLMEQGTNPEMFGAIAKRINAMEQSYEARVERYKDVYKLNYGGAVDVEKMSQRIGKNGYTKEQFGRDVAAMQKDQKYQSEETTWQNKINEIATNEALMGQSKFWENIAYLDEIISELLNKNKCSTTEEYVNDAIAKKTGQSSATIEANIKAAAMARGYNYSEVAAVNTNYEMQPIGEELNATGSILRGKETGDLGKIAQGIQDRARHLYRGSGGYEADIYNRVINNNVGDEEKDAVLLTQMARYGVDMPKEINKVFSALGTGQIEGDKYHDVYNAYTDKNVSVDEFIKKLAIMFQDLKFTVETP